MSAREALLLAALLLVVAAAVALYVLAPAGRAAWLSTITLGATAAGLVLARAGRMRKGPA
jgi:hypothetical protein